MYVSTMTMIIGTHKVESTCFRSRTSPSIIIIIIVIVIIVVVVVTGTFRMDPMDSEFLVLHFFGSSSMMSVTRHRGH
jgi:hypothetical protein